MCNLLRSVAKYKLTMSFLCISEDEVKDLRHPITEHFFSSWYKASRSSKSMASIVYLDPLEKHVLMKWFAKMHIRIQKSSALFVTSRRFWSLKEIQNQYLVTYSLRRFERNARIPIDHRRHRLYRRRFYSCTGKSVTFGHAKQQRGILFANC
jgi:hypothetical protein